MTKDEALRIALDAFGEIAWSNETRWQSNRAKVAITAIEAAREQPQERYTYGTPLLDAMVGCPPCNNHCNQGRTCPNRQIRKTTREEKITNPGVYSTSQMAKDGFVEANIKRTQMLKEAMDNEHKYMNYRAAFPKEYDGKSLMRMQDRNETLEEVAMEFEKMPFGDTGASICAYIRGMKT